MNNYILTSIILSYFLLITAFIYGCSSKQIRNNELSKWVVIYLGFILVIEAINHFSITILETKTTHYLYPLYFVGEFLILMSIFLKELKAPKKWKIIKGLVAGYIFIESAILWFINDDASNGYGKIISHLTILCLLAILLIKNLKELEENNHFSIIYIALFLYYGVSLFLFLLINQLTEMNINIWIINNILSSILYGSFIFTFYKLKK
ncbi:hypothetical protein BTO04_03495 [Polaribacter sp. SA4-10]|uniref:hypothetical protein n=1 Tax=Polaribacter sp. SA4-10 TaxID=754397 RepID=UPI000B3D081D|nr:hypothetical protein [Polaribacter sp. SA4-10]ARV05818.1 hypothetical protein BTO04_03495 [Polaribacter sp. SA4-10]